MRNYGVPNRSHSQCALIDEGQVEIKRRGRERERERKRERERERKKRKERERERERERGGREMEKVHPETFIYFTF